MERSSSYSWRVIAASVKGAGHEEVGEPCQDAYAWRQLQDGILIAAIADGAGSAALAEVGAQRAVNAAVTWLFHRLSSLPSKGLSKGRERLFLLSALYAAREALESEASACDCSLDDLHTTLIALLATAEMVAAAQIGDGAAIVGDSKGDIIALTTPQSGEYINETVFLTTDDFPNKAQFSLYRTQRVSHIALLSDGLQMLALRMPSGQPHAPFFTPLFQFISNVEDLKEATHQLSGFLRAPRVREHTADDLTLLIAALNSKTPAS